MHPYPAFLDVRLLSSSQSRHEMFLALQDQHGRNGAGCVSLIDFLPAWRAFLADYIRLATGENKRRAFGRALFNLLLPPGSDLRACWLAIEAARGHHALHLTVCFDTLTEALAGLPLELLHDDVNFLFNRPGFALDRAFAMLEPARGPMRLPPNPRVLFAWACPQGVDSFDPAPHLTMLQEVFGQEHVAVCPRASLLALRQQLEDASFNLLHLLAHGLHPEDGLGVVALDSGQNSVDLVHAQRLAQVVQGRGMQLAFLCSCQSAMAQQHLLAGTAQQLLASPAGEGIGTVVATQANLPVANSHLLARHFYALLRQPPWQPGPALARARHNAFSDKDLTSAWSVPILLTRPPQRGERPITRQAHSQVPELPEAFQPRPEHSEAILKLLERHRVVSVVGLPGIGKTELCKVVASGIEERQPDQRVIYQTIDTAIPADLLRARVATALGMTQPPADDRQLADWLADRPTLLVLDNLEATMADHASQQALARQLTTWLNARSLRLLLATRWAVGLLQPGERQYPVPAMTPDQTEAMLRRELELRGVFAPHWQQDPAWRQLLAFLDGHPRSVWLVARHFDEPGTSLAGMVARLQTFKAAAVVDPSLWGRADLPELDQDQHQRMTSLVASMNFSFQVLAQRHPDAVLAFLQLALFPAGLPEAVAWAVTGGRERLVLEPLYRYHLLEWRNRRVFYPVPLRWYAEQQAMGKPDVMACRPALLGLAVKAYAEYAESLDEEYIKTQSVEIMAQWLAEEQTWLWLADQACAPDQGNISSWGRLAAAGINLFSMTNRLAAWKKLTQYGARDAALRGDRYNEAHCLQSLGNLAMRKNAMDEARQHYGRALTIFREIQARLGEANCLSVLGLVCAFEGNRDAAWQNFGKALVLFREIKERQGEQGTLGYLARVLAGEAANLALVLAGRALAIGRQIRDRSGQIITLSWMMNLWIQQKALPAVLAGAILLGSLAREIGEKQRLAWSEQILAALRPHLQGQMPSVEEAWQMLEDALAQAEAALTGEERQLLQQWVGD